jgi:hypothetical protein
MVLQGASASVEGEYLFTQQDIGPTKRIAPRALGASFREDAFSAVRE